MVDVSSEVEGVVRASGFKNGICTVFCVGSTGSIVSIEYEEGLLKDFPEAMERLAPVEAVYDHHLRGQDGTGQSHERASIVGPSLTAPFVDSQLTLGTWQQIAFVDFDNRSRNRKVEVMLVGE